MEYLTKYFDHSGEQALAAYNWGMGNVRSVVVSQGSGYLEVCPEETQDYVAKIFGFLEGYRSEADKT